MIALEPKNRKLLSAEELMEEKDTLGIAMDVFMIDNVLNNCMYKMFEKEYMQRLDAHVRQQYPEIPGIEEVPYFDRAVRDIYREREEDWENSLPEIKNLRFDKIGILFHLARRDRPTLSFEEYIAELCV
ncbi:MAG: hypothetical protein K2N63_07590 [Lachnospiraceae bacterium]|nr:hypothetical protein [Lachnospiraceae bacterium]